jgi:shikimate kinase/shikimate kinase/3-dehydroquinate synthase
VKKNLVLLGMMGVGKSTLGKIVAKKLDLKFADTDLNIEKNCSMKILEIFKNKGEDFFRSEEEKEALECLKKNNTVIALGGGAFMNKNIRSLILKNSLSFWLDLNLNIINKRVKWSKKRPLLNQKKEEEIIKKLYSERKNIYKLAKYKINCNKLSKTAITKKIILFYENYKIKHKN